MEGRIMDLNAVALFSALVVAVLNAHADPLSLLNSLISPRMHLAH